jgi:hypothetical protein
MNVPKLFETIYSREAPVRTRLLLSFGNGIEMICSVTGVELYGKISSVNPEPVNQPLSGSQAAAASFSLTDIVFMGAEMDLTGMKGGMYICNNPSELIFTSVFILHLF